jgi:hypothetical protein
LIIFQKKFDHTATVSPAPIDKKRSFFASCLRIDDPTKHFCAKIKLLYSKAAPDHFSKTIKNKRTDQRGL